MNTVVNAALKNVRLALAKTSEPERAATLRVAVQFLKKAQRAQFDMICRLQVLEGAAGVRPGTWSNRGKMGLRAAADSFKNESVQPAWFATTDTGMYMLLWRQVDQVLRKVPGVDADDIMANALSGLALDLGESKRPLYEAGRKLADAIKSGDESPTKVAAGLAGFFLKRKALNEVKRQQRQQKIMGPTLQDNEAGTIPDESEQDSFEALLLAMRDKSDPLGRRLRQIMRDQIEARRSEDAKAGLHYWLDTFEKTGQFPSYDELGRQFGVALQTVKQRWIEPLLEDFDYALKANRSIMSEIRRRQEIPAARLASTWYARKAYRK